ncbi:MAG: nitroreductase family protein [Clostridia bacterium]
MEFLKLAEQRYSVRKFKPESIPQEQVGAILQAGHLAPTGKNTQPQRILILDNQESLEKLKDCTKCHFDAPLAMLVCADSEDCYIRPYDGKYGHEIDASIVTTYMMLKAQEMGIGSTWVMHFNPTKMRETFAVPEKYDIVALLVMGYPAEDATPSPLHYQFDDEENVVFYNKF